MRLGAAHCIGMSLVASKRTWKLPLHVHARWRYQHGWLSEASMIGMGLSYKPFPPLSMVFALLYLRVHKDGISCHELHQLYDVPFNHKIAFRRPGTEEVNM